MIDNDSIIQVKEVIESQATKINVALIAAIISLIIGILNVYFSRKNHKEQLKEKKREERRKEISRALNEFYGPFQQYLNISKELFKLLRKGKPKGFRTLDYLINKETLFPDDKNHLAKALLTKVDEEILCQIIETGSKLESLIVEKAGLVDDPVLRYNYTSNPYRLNCNQNNFLKFFHLVILLLFF